jgi:tetratricopeptide (TPR) repeat protein
MNSSFMTTNVSGPLRYFLALVVGLLLSQFAFAMSFEPTEAEWPTWQPFCQARYMESAAGRNSPFADRIPAAAVRSWEARLGSEVWYGLHHYCGGLILENRAKRDPDKRQRTLTLKRVIEEYAFTMRRISSPNPIRAEIAARKGLVHRDLGEIEQAEETLEVAIQDCIKCAVGYQAKSMFYRDRGDLVKAREVLEKGNVATEGQSADLHYFLGLVLLDMKEFDAARQHARSAYDLGYPLPGLRDRLASAGYPLE